LSRPRLVGLGLFIALFVPLAWLAFRPRGSGAADEEEPEVEPLVRVHVEVARSALVTSEVTIDGRLEALPDQEARLAAPVEGRLVRVAVREGQTVKAGQLLAEIRSPSLSGAVTAARGAVAASEAAVERARRTSDSRSAEERTDIAQAEAALEAAQAKLGLTQAGPRPEEVRQAQAELDREVAKLQELERGERPEDIAAARQAVAAEQAALDALRHGPLPQEIAAQEAVVAAERAELRKLEAGPRRQELIQAQSAAKSAQTALDAARSEVQRQARLFADGISSLAAKQAAEVAYASAESAYEAAAQNLAMLREGTRAEDVEAQRARVRREEAELDRLRSGTRAEAVAGQEARLRAAQEALRKAEAGPRPETVTGQRAEVERARQALAVLRAGPRPEEVQAAQAAVADARAALDRAKAGHFQTQAVLADVRAAQAQREQSVGALETAEGLLAFTRVSAPVSGVVGRIMANTGEMVSAGAPLLEVLNLNSLQLRGRTPLSELGSLAIGDTARVKVDGLAERIFEGRVAVVGADVDTETNTGEVVVWLENAQHVLKEGAFATATIATAGVERVTVPAQALVSEEAEQFVFVADADDVARKVAVTVGRRQGDMAEIVSGLKAGERVVTVGAFGLEDGVKLRVES